MLRAGATFGLAVGLCLALAVAGCGGGGDSQSTGQATQAITALRGPKPPKGASPLVHHLYRTFQPPRADPEVSGSAKAIKAGEAACKGKTPKQVEQRYFPLAVAKGALDPKSAQGKMIAGVAHFEKRPDSAYTAGQLAGDAYEATLEGEAASYGYQGCVYGLARELEGRLGG